MSKRRKVGPVREALDLVLTMSHDMGISVEQAADFIDALAQNQKDSLEPSETPVKLSKRIH